MFRTPQVPQWRRIATPIALAAVSLFVALVLWIAVSDAENPQVVVELVVPVKAVNVPEGLAVANISPSSVRLRVRTDENPRDPLAPADFEVIADLSATRESADVPLSYNYLRSQDVAVIDSVPGIVNVALETSITKQVPVRPSPVGVLPQGYTLPNVPEVTPATVRVAGASGLIARVEYVTADVNLTGLRANLTQQTVLVPRDARGLEISRVQVEPARAETRVVVLQQEITVQIPVLASLQGVVAEGYNIVGVTVDPQTIPINGTLESTQALSSINTEPVDVSGLSRDVSRTVRLRLPSGVQANRESVNVRIRIAPVQGEILLSVAPQHTSVADGLTPSFQTSAISLRLQGDLPELRSLTPGTVRATVNASGLQEGVHVLSPQISNLPQGVQVVSMDPNQVVLVLRR